MSARATIEGVGSSVPAKLLTNDDLAKLVDTSDEWIAQRTGIKVRHMCADDETTSVLATRAAKGILEDAKVDAEEVELVICGTITSDMLFPSTACLVQEAIGAKNAGAFDVGAACASFIYALQIGASMVESGAVANAIVLGADALTRFVDWTDRSTCVLFGDAAAGVYLKRTGGGDRGVIQTVLRADGSGARHINIEAGGSLHPAGLEGSAAAKKYVYMAGQEVYRFAVNAMVDACKETLRRSGMDSSDVDLFVPHQANLRIIESAADRLDLPSERVFINVQEYGNTSGASIPLGLHEAQKAGRLERGMVVMTVGFGAGLVWGANLIRW